MWSLIRGSFRLVYVAFLVFLIFIKIARAGNIFSCADTGYISKFNDGVISLPMVLVGDEMLFSNVLIRLESDGRLDKGIYTIISWDEIRCAGFTRSTACPAIKESVCK